jgi:hypothetical protein
MGVPEWLTPAADVAGVLVGVSSMAIAFLQILDRDGWICHWCGKPLVGSDATVDHLQTVRLRPDLTD